MNRDFVHERPLYLHLGCGENRLPGPHWVNIDEFPGSAVDIADNVMFLRRFKKESVAGIYMCSVLEHISRHFQTFVLQRYYDLLEPGGFLRISVPDFNQVVERYLEKRNIKELWGFLHGGQDHPPSNIHTVSYDFKTLSADLLAIGFKKVERYDWKKTPPHDDDKYDDYSRSYIPHKEFSSGRLMHLNINAWK